MLLVCLSGIKVGRETSKTRTIFSANAVRLDRGLPVMFLHQGGFYRIRLDNQVRGVFIYYNGENSVEISNGSS